MINTSLDFENEFKREGSFIKEIPLDDLAPILYLSNERLLCMRKRGDAPTIIVVGKRGSGKTLLSHTILDLIKEVWNCCIAIFDSQDEIYWRYKGKERIKKEDTVISLLPSYNPKGMNIVDVYPATQSIIENCKIGLLGKDKVKLSELTNQMIQDTPMVLMTIKFKEILDDITSWTEMTHDQYSGSIKEKLIECNSFEEVDELLKGTFFTRGLEGYNPGIYSKLKKSLKKLWDLKIIDKCTKEGIIKTKEDIHPEINFGTPTAELEVYSGGERIYKNNVFNSLMRFDFIPVFKCGEILSKSIGKKGDYFAYPYIASILRKIQYNQKYDSYFKKKTIYFYFPELHKFVSTSNKSNAGLEVFEIANSGRIYREGLFYDTQHYWKIPSDIRGNKDYGFILKQEVRETCNELCKDFSIDSKIYIEEMMNLDTFECLAISKEENAFTIIDLKTGNKKNCSGIFKGQILPPRSLHIKPKYG